MVETEILLSTNENIILTFYDIYRKDITPKENLEKLDLLKYSKDYYRKRGTGRPTKKDRRDIDDIYNNDDFFETDSEE